MTYMDHTVRAIEMASLLLGIVSFSLIWERGMERVSIDSYRHQLFCLRRELFLLAEDGKVSVRNPAYTHLRTSLNQSIRNAERLKVRTVLLAIMFSPMRRREPSPYEDAAKRALEALEPSLASRLTEMRDQSNAASIALLFKRSPLTFTLMFLGLALIFVIKRGIGAGSQLRALVAQRMVAMLEDAEDRLGGEESDGALASS